MTNEQAIKELKTRYLTMSQCLDKEELHKANKDIDMAIKALEQTRWIPVSEKLPEENEYIGDVCKYYLIQDEYGDMHVAHLSNVGWIPMDSLKAIGDEVIAYMPLPQPFEPQESEVQK